MARHAHTLALLTVAVAVALAGCGGALSGPSDQPTTEAPAPTTTQTTTDAPEVVTRTVTVTVTVTETTTPPTTTAVQTTVPTTTVAPTTTTTATTTTTTTQTTTAEPEYRDMLVVAETGDFRHARILLRKTNDDTVPDLEANVTLEYWTRDDPVVQQAFDRRVTVRHDENMSIHHWINASSKVEGKIVEVYNVSPA